MPDKFSILVLDLHNTIYDEVTEFGLSINEAINVWLETAQNLNKPLAREKLYEELSAAHRKLGSDWDEDAWRLLPSLKGLELTVHIFEETLRRATKARQDKSRQLTCSGVFDGVVQTLHHLKKRGVRIYIVTEAAADAGMLGISWLGLSSVIDVVYTYPSRIQPLTLEDTYHSVFPAEGDGHIKKPNSLLLARVALDDAVKTNKVSQDVRLEDICAAEYFSGYALEEFPLSSPIQRDIAARLIIKEGPYKELMQRNLNDMLYVGDSKFKDGLLARNAGVSFGLAAYGKKVKPGGEENFSASKDILYAVTGWDKELLKLTQEAEKSKTVSALQPDFIFEKNLAESMKLFI